jgi:hypothetical protein
MLNAHRDARVTASVTPASPNRHELIADFN